jgi:hypothetical protein
MNAFMVLVVLVGAVGACACTVWLWVRAMQPAPGEAPEDGGAYWDAGVLHVCWHCGTRINGPDDGLKIPDRECWECYCARYRRDDDNPAVPTYVAPPVRRA